MPIQNIPANTVDTSVIEQNISELQGQYSALEQSVTANSNSINGINNALPGKSDTDHNHDGTYEPANANIQSHISDTGKHLPTLGGNKVVHTGLDGGLETLDLTIEQPAMSPSTWGFATMSNYDGHKLNTSNFQVNDAGASSTDIWSAEKSTAELNTKLTKTAYSHSYCVQGEIVVPDGQEGVIPLFYVPVLSGYSSKIISAKYQIGGGTSVTATLKKNGTAITAYTDISITTTPATTTADESLSNGDSLQLEVTAVSATPTNLTFSIFIETEVTSA